MVDGIWFAQLSNGGSYPQGSPTPLRDFSSCSTSFLPFSSEPQLRGGSHAPFFNNARELRPSENLRRSPVWTRFSVAHSLQRTSAATVGMGMGGYRPYSMDSTATSSTVSTLVFPLFFVGEHFEN